jgi:hypothetical protein
VIDEKRSKQTQLNEPLLSPERPSELFSPGTRKTVKIDPNADKDILEDSD